MNSRRVMTSAIEGMSVADVRRNLATIRTKWRDHSPTKAFQCHAQLQSHNVSEFCFLFVLGHHRKRHAKSQRLTTNPAA